uniref:Uncharacterized protein n=1 Tax=Avena sativa TaxID=4498 RepID=A0ACD5ZC26_AVESA
MNRLEGSDQSATQLDQVKLCTNIGIECMDIDPKKRPDARHIIDRLNKTASTIETIISSSLLDQHVSFPKDQYCQEKNSKLLSKDLEMDTKESAEMEELAEYGWTHRVGHCQQGQEETPVDQWLLWRVRDRKQNVSPQGARISGSNSGVLYKLKNLSIFNRKARREFLRSGGSILRNSAYLRIFRKGELKQILKDEKFIGKSVFGEVYKGLVGNVPVVVMKQISDAPLDKNQFISIVQSRVRHKNIVEMIGVCLEADVPMLVYEFLSSSLHDILHMSNLHLSLGLRLSIAADSAGGLAYIHSDHVKSLHGNLKPTNIFLDHKLVAKIWDFGISMMFGVDTQMIGSDITYTDPVYLQTGVLTTKSDVYSFGVVILELLTRKKATHDDNNGLVRKLLENHEMGRKSTELFDQEIAAPGDLEFVDSLAEIVMECLSQDMDLRPTMVDVAKRLSILSKSYELALSGSIISGSISGVPNKLKNRSISNEKVQKEILRYGGSSLTNLAAMSFISTGILKEFLKDEKFIGKGAFGEVYKGLAGDEPVVVMKLISDDVLDINQFVREFSIQSCARHKNIVKMIGVCLDADVPMLVYEFLCNGSLHEILHRSNLHLSLGLRLSIAADSAGGLAYIHSDHVKSLHGNLTPTNIFLDHKLVAKILDFGISRMFGVGTEMIGGDITYTDPVYLQTGLLTTKSDVYSFGVVILELLTRKKATHDDNNGLVRKLLENHKMGRKSTELFDQELAAPGDLEFVDNLAEIAMECLSQDTDLRPTMADVAKRLSILSKSYELALLQKATS